MNSGMITDICSVVYSFGWVMVFCLVWFVAASL